MRTCHSQMDTTSPHNSTHSIVLSHQEDLLAKGHFSFAFPTPGVLDLVFGGTAGGPYLQSACFRRITSSRSPAPMAKLGRGGFFKATPQATFGQEEVSPLGICRVTEESSTHSAGVEGGGLVALSSAATDTLAPPESKEDSDPVRRCFSMSIGSPFAGVGVRSLVVGAGTVPKSTHWEVLGGGS